MDDQPLIEAFVTYLQQHGHPGLKIDRRPEEENRVSPDIDAIAGPFAIEHTSIDSVPDQRRNSAWFMEAVGRLEDEVHSLPFRLNIIVKYEAVSTGQNWPDVREAIKNWILTQSASLHDGARIVQGIPGVPFELHVRKSSSRQPGLFFSRFAPNDTALPARVKEQLDRKARKLAPYQAAGNISVLLVENEDIALMNDGVMLEAVQTAYPNDLPQGVDEIWYADTSLASDIAFYHFTPALTVPAKK